MKNAMTKKTLLLTLIDSLSDIGGVISAICLLTVSVIIVYEATLRYVFNSPTTWVQELTVYLAMAIGLLGAAYSLKNNSHLSITFVIDKLSVTNQRRMRILTNAAGVAYSSVFIYEGINMVQFSYEMEDISTGTMATPLWIPGLLIPVTGGLLTLQFIKKLAEAITQSDQE